MRVPKFTLLAITLGFSFATGAYAAEAEQGHGTVTFTGSIISAPCSITPETIDQTVPLGQISDSALEGRGTSTPVQFQIGLENCKPDTAATVTFNGTADSADSTELGLSGTAQGAGIVLTDQSGNQLELGEPSETQSLQAGPNMMQFSAYLRGDPDPSRIKPNVVVPGDFQSVANFSLAYQ
ncbi:fimbrial protein [Enterobacter mori]|uniref:fimbrial protein n=1 Tax=Enterobacter mori TaxID=539813 RepID=UPI002ED17708|nr:fimbrial protein [Enterobacter mori]